MAENKTPGWFGSLWKEAPEPNPTPNQEQTVKHVLEDGKVSRRELLKAIGSVMVDTAMLGSLATWQGAERYIEEDMENRTRSVREMGAFLRGERPGMRIEMFDRDWQYIEVIGLLQGLSTPRLSDDQVAELLDSFSYMIEVEDQFGDRFNTLPVLEKVDLLAERVVGKDVDQIATSFGYGQINPNTARRLALAHRSELIRYNVLTAEQIVQLDDPNILERDVVEILELTSDGNIVFSFLAFYEVYNLYGRSRSTGMINVIREHDPRSFSLAVAGYSARPESPRNAKLQTIVNELMIFDDATRTVVNNRVGLGEDRLLDVDGDLGPNTKEAIRTVAEVLNVEVPEGLFEESSKVEGGEEAQQELMDAFMRDMMKMWKDRVTFYKMKEPENAGQLKEFVGGRYSTVIKTYLILKEMAGEDAPKVRELFFLYADKRDTTFLDFIDDPVLLQKEFPNIDHEAFRSRVAESVAGSVSFDNRYRGYVPLMYRAPSKWGGDPKNVVMRVLLAHELDEESRSAVGIKQ